MKSKSRSESVTAKSEIVTRKSQSRSELIKFVAIVVVSIVLNQIIFKIYDGFIQFSPATNTSLANATSSKKDTKADVLNENSSTDNQTKYWFFIKDNKYYIFETVDRVLKRLGLELIPVNETNSTIPNDWDLLWSYNALHFVPLDRNKIRSNQKINHWPGNTHMSSKSIFTTNTDSKYVPKGFLTSDDVKKYVEVHPNKRFVVKKKSNRGVILQNVSEMNFTNSKTNDGYFAMEFVENPLLFDGHKFDFAVYVVITSVDPLRLYFYNKNIIMRICPKTYDTSDPKDRDRYVVRSSHIPGSEFPSVKKYFTNGYTYKEAFNAFLKSKGIDESKIWETVEDLIRSVVLSKENLLIQAVKKYGATKYSFFEMFRFDLFLDNDLNLFIFEINSSPNIYSGHKYANNRHVYESVLFNLFNLIGVGRSIKSRRFGFPNYGYETMAVHPNSLSVKPETCMNLLCNTSCSPECELCRDCLSNNQKYVTKLAYLEQKNSGDMKRLFPPSKAFIEKADESFWNSLEPESKLHTKWFIEMCKKDEKFC